MINYKPSIEIVDVTLRDGEQTHGVSFTPDEKLNLAKALLTRLGVDRLELASARVSEGERLAVQKTTQWASEIGLLNRIEILGFVDHTKSIDWILENGATTLNLLTKGSEHHCTQQLKKTLDQHLSDIAKTVEYAHQKGVTINLYLEDWSNGYYNSPSYVYQMVSRLKDQGIGHIMLPDTLGVLSPAQVYESLQDMRARFPWASFDFHPHNDYGLATANSLAAFRAGVSAIHCTINCMGERAGNASLAEVVVALRDIEGATLSIQEEALGPISEMVENLSGKRIAANTPILGDDVFTQTSGIHADGDKKGNLYQTQLSPERFGRVRTYALGKMSGKASLKQNLEKIGFQLSEEDQQKVLNRIIELGDSKKRITLADLPFIITDVLQSKAYQRIRLVNCSITSVWKLEAIASVCLDIDGTQCLGSGAGNGGYDAFMKAIKRMMKSKGFVLPELMDYEVHIPKGGKTSALTETRIVWRNQKESFTTIGVDSDQVMAAVQATLKMLNLSFPGQTR